MVFIYIILIFLFLLQEFNAVLQQEYGLPSWGAYALFAVGTIFVGAILGLTLVCLIDLLYPPKKTQRQSYAQGRKRNESGIEDLANDELLDDATEADGATLLKSNTAGKYEIKGMENVMDIDDMDDEDDDDDIEAETTTTGEKTKGEETAYDDADSAHTSDGEKNSRSESEEPESDIKEAGNLETSAENGEKISTSLGEMRKRKPRKAD